MTKTPLDGVGVLVTRPAAQASELVTAIGNAGGRSFEFPVIEIVPRNTTEVAADIADLPTPHIVIFVSRNAVEFGMQYVDESTRLAVIGPATASAVRAAGRHVSIQPGSGFDSESLLAEAALSDVAGRNILIVRGQSGRELMTETLRERGASVHHLHVYDRRRPHVDTDTRNMLESAWRRGEINVTTAMSMDSLHSLLALLPPWCAEHLGAIPLVTPAARVLREMQRRYPAARPKLAAGPASAEMLAAIIATQTTTCGKN